MNGEILEARERMEEERKAMVQECEELYVLRERQQKYEDLERRLESSEYIKRCLSPSCLSTGNLF